MVRFWWAPRKGTVVPLEVSDETTKIFSRAQARGGAACVVARSRADQALKFAKGKRAMEGLSGSSKAGRAPVGECVASSAIKPTVPSPRQIAQAQHRIPVLGFDFHTDGLAVPLKPEQDALAGADR